MVKQFLAGKTVQINIEPFVDDDGNELEIESVVYRIVDENGVILKDDESLQFTPGADTKLTVESQYNGIDEIDINEITRENKDAVRISGARTIEFDILLMDGNTIGHELTYILNPRERLFVGLNSFQKLSESTLTASSIYDVGDFLSASANERISALIEAKDRLARLSYKSVTSGQNYLNSSSRIELSDLSPLEYQALSEGLKSALRKAQVAEANYILGGGDVIENLRRQGITSQTIGETHESYRDAIPVTQAVCSAAMGYISEFVITGKRIARA